jgi:dephospho-CoA kinase
MSNKPLQIGITGGIGSGKSLICKIFSCLGIPIYDADSRAKSIMTTDGILVGQIKKEFGSLAYSKDGKLNREYLSTAVFNDAAKLKRLNELVHPRVGADSEKWVEENATHPYLLREAALLFESGSFKKLDKVIVVTAPEALRVKRVLQRDKQRTEQEVIAIIRNQMTEEEKVKRADFVIHNDETELVVPQVLKWHEQFIAMGTTRFFV